MVTPPKGDYISIPLSDEGRRVAFQWDPATDGSCKAFGAAGLMHIPTRLNITWQGDDVLKVESDAGQQTRLLQFAPKSGPGARSLQGFSVAEWEALGVAGPGRGGVLPPRALKVVTTNLLEGWLRKNGVPYSEQTTLTEHWDRVAFPNGDVWLTVSQYVSDPKYLTGDYTTSMHFKKNRTGRSGSRLRAVRSEWRRSYETHSSVHALGSGAVDGHEFGLCLGPGSGWTHRRRRWSSLPARGRW